MASPAKHVRAHIHWIIKIVLFVGVISSLLSANYAWLRDDPFDAARQVFLAFFMGTVFFATDTKIEADERGIRLTAVHGIYALDWREVKAVEVKGLTTRFYGEKKAVGYNLLFVGKGKRDLKVFVADMIQRYQIPRGRPPGVKNSQIGQLARNARIRGWKLF